jgi:hypothetical protein
MSSSSGGRPRAEAAVVDCTVVVQEAPADGSPHFHAVVKLFRQMRFKLAKQTLQERHRLPSHWSSSHSQLWSAIRYIHVATPSKPHVDADRFVWTSDDRALDLWELSREPFTAEAWRKRGEKKEASAVAADKKSPTYNALYFKSLIISKHLHTKASLLAYVQDFGSPSQQIFASKNQRRLNELIEDAHEWAEAKSAASDELLTDWEVLMRASRAPCRHAPSPCPYAASVEDVFHRNAATLSPHRLASSLRKLGSRRIPVDAHRFQITVAEPTGGNLTS